MKDDEFYIGFEDRAPAGLARFTKLTVIAAVCLSLAAGVVLAFTQNVYGPSVYEFENWRRFEGVVGMEPYPHLRVRRPGRSGGLSFVSSYLLVDPFKFGGADYVKDFAGRRIILEGALLYRENRTMIAVRPGTVQLADGENAALPAVNLSGGARRELGSFTMRGEIVDSKCYLGAMNPGEWKTHRGCAIRCISGGIPPLFVVRDGETVRHFLLTDAAGQTVNDRVLALVALPLEIKGEVEYSGGWYVLKADPDTYTRL